MVARNFYEGDGNILYPRVDVGGEKTGIVGCEFPLLNYAIAGCAKVFGYQHWYGRLINLIVSCLGVYFFSKLVTKYFDRWTAFLASLIMMVSIWFTYCRTNIPDTFGLSICLAALFYGLAYLENGKVVPLVLYFVLALAGTLAKISTACILSVLVIPFLFGASTLTRRIILTSASVLLLAIVFWWYFVWVPHLNETYGLYSHFFMGLPWSDGIQQLIDDAPLTMKRFYSTAMKYAGFIFFVAGIILMIKKRATLALSIVTVSFFAALVVILKTGYGMHINAYYMIIFIPPMALAAAYALSQLQNRKIAVALLLVICAEGLLNQIHILKIREPNLSLTQLENIVDRFSTRSDLIAINGSGEEDPTPMYFAHRKGWVLPNAKLTERLPIIRTKGCKLVVILKQIGGDMQLDFPILYESDAFKIYDIK